MQIKKDFHQLHNNPATDAATKPSPHQGFNKKCSLFCKKCLPFQTYFLKTRLITSSVCWKDGDRVTKILTKTKLWGTKDRTSIWPSVTVWKFELIFSAEALKWLIPTKFFVKQKVHLISITPSGHCLVFLWRHELIVSIWFKNARRYYSSIYSSNTRMLFSQILWIWLV